MEMVTYMFPIVSCILEAVCRFLTGNTEHPNLSDCHVQGDHSVCMTTSSSKIDGYLSENEV